MGLEPTAFAVTGRRCNQLNYTPALKMRSSSQTTDDNQFCLVLFLKCLIPFCPPFFSQSKLLEGLARTLLLITVRTKNEDFNRILESGKPIMSDFVPSHIKERS